MQKGFFTKAIKDEDISEQFQQPPDSRPSTNYGENLRENLNRSSPKPTPSWLSVMIVDQRRGSFGFGAHSPMDDDHSNPGGANFNHGDLNQSHSNRNTNHSGAGFSIPKSAFGGMTSSKNEGGGDTAGSLLMENAPLIKISEEGQVFVQDTRRQDHEFVGGNSDANRINQNLSEKVSTAISLGDFPVATQESLAELREMKERLYAVKEDSVGK